MNYQECLEYLDQASKFGIKLGLESTRTLLSELGSPQDFFPSVIVAGTNGKGSVCAMIQSSLERHGFRVGLYTSPHLIRIEERIRVNRSLISEEDFCELINLTRDREEALRKEGKLCFPPTYFEILTCAAFLYFAREKVDMAILEVGMGGRLDATNVVKPLLSVITTVSLDHQEYLGRTKARIAAEKAGVIKPGTPVVCGQLDPPVEKVIKARATELQAPVIKVFGRGKWSKVRRSQSTFVFHHNQEDYVYRPGLMGEHQGRNAAIAIAALKVISERWKALDKQKIIAGIENVIWEGRLERICQIPEVYLDGAHNEEGAKALRYFWERQTREPRVLIFAILKDKDIRKVARQLFPLAQKVILTSIPCPRAALPEQVMAATSDLNPRIIIEPDLKKALQLGIREAGTKGTVLVTGSLYLVGAVKRTF